MTAFHATPFFSLAGVVLIGLDISTGIYANSTEFAFSTSGKPALFENQHLSSTRTKTAITNKSLAGLCPLSQSYLPSEPDHRRAVITKLLKIALAFGIGFGLGLIAVFLNGDFVIHVPVLLGVLAVALYLIREKWWAFWI